MAYNLKVILLLLHTSVVVSKQMDSEYLRVLHDMATRNHSFEVSSKHKVKIEVFYETLCPASIRFFTKQLQPAIEILAPYLDVHLVPYGHAKTRRVRGRYVFRCQHGAAECYGNRLHACVVNELQNNTKAVLFNTCLMQYTAYKRNRLDYDSVFEWCCYKLNVHMYGVTKCVNGDQGSFLLRDYGVETHALQPYYVPYLVIDGSTDEQKQDRATANLIGTVCQMLEPTPPPCYNYT